MPDGEPLKERLVGFPTLEGNHASLASPVDDGRGNNGRILRVFAAQGDVLSLEVDIFPLGSRGNHNFVAVSGIVDCSLNGGIEKVSGEIVD